jgi:hypothetical protein
MKPNEIKAAIIKADTNQRALAAYLGISYAVVSRVVNGKCRSARVEAELANIIGHNPFPPVVRSGAKKKVWSGVPVVTHYPSAELDSAEA